MKTFYLAAGSKIYLENGKVHRKNGPAIEYANGAKAWFYNDQYVNCNTQEEFERWLNLKAFW